MPKTDVVDFLGELGAGTVQEKLEQVLSDVALSVVLHGDGRKKGKVSLEFTFARVGENDQVIVDHKIGYTAITKRGKRMEEDVTETPFFVGKGGVLSISPPKEGMTGQFNLHDVNEGKQ